jgi:preprotein translocase subunit SecF
MQILKEDININFMGGRKLAMIFSVVILLIAAAALAMRGLSFGIDFTGGTIIEVGYEKAADLQVVRQVLTENEFADATVQQFGTPRDVLIRLAPRPGMDSAGLSDQIVSILKTTSDSAVDLRRVEFVGPQVGGELTEDGALAVLVAMMAILMYVALRFEWRFAVGSVIALIHDVLFTIGLFALLQIEFDLPVLAAVLAVIGYSLNDTIVVYDRIRENFRKMRKGTPEQVINN